MRCYRPLLLLLLIASPSVADNLTYLRIDNSVLQSRAEKQPTSDQSRLQMLRAQFRSAGCSGQQLQEQPLGEERLPNLICTLPGTQPETILVGARFDYKSKGEEAAVGWATVALLPLLAESLNAAPHRHTLVFAAFSGHEHGFDGATHYLQQLTAAQRKSIVAMIDLDHLGRVPPSYAFSHSGASQTTFIGRRAVARSQADEATTLSKTLETAATALQYPYPLAIDNQIATTDARSFVEAGISSIILHSESYIVVRTFGDTPVRFPRTLVDAGVYDLTYNFLCVYLVYVDKSA